MLLKTKVQILAGKKEYYLQTVPTPVLKWTCSSASTREHYYHRSNSWSECLAYWAPTTSSSLRYVPIETYKQTGTLNCV
jgi:hypothetical protein